MPALLARRVIALLAFGCVVSGCVTGRPLACRAGERPLTQDSLYFGTASPNGPVSEAQWQTFVTQIVAAELPKGFTLLRAQGAWRGDSGDLQYEDSHVLEVVHEDDAASDAAITRVINRYKQQFQQEAVLRIRAATCAAF